MRLEPRGRAVLVIGIILILLAYTLPRSELVYAGSLLIALPLVALASVRFRRRALRVSRRFSPPIAEVGGPVTVHVEVRNLASTGTGETMWRDEWPWAPYGTQSARLSPLSRNRGSLGAAGSTTVSYVLTPPRRGVFDIGPLVVEASDPFRVSRGEMVLGGTATLIVAPRVAAFPDTGSSAAADEGSARALQRLDSTGGDELMTREYRHGDSLRRVHWKASARHDELMVRMEEQRTQARASIFLDTRRPGYRDTVPPTDDQPESDSFEWAVAFTASLAFHLQRIGFTVDVIESGYRQLAPAQYPEEFLTSLSALALVDGAVSRQVPPIPHPGRYRGRAFALVADAEPSTLERLSAERPRFDTAVAIVINPHNDAVSGRLREAGWTCIAARPTDDLVAVWFAASELAEVRSGSL